jgi:predicted nucleic acid-binding Zn finger protein
MPRLRAERAARAVAEHLTVRRDPRFGSFVVLEVRNPAHRSRYRVAFPALPDLELRFCSCVDFARRGMGTCKHVEAAILWVADRAEASGVDLRVDEPETVPSARWWAVVDQHLAESRVGSTITPRSLRLVGALLYRTRKAVGLAPAA